MAINVVNSSHVIKLSFFMIHEMWHGDFRIRLVKKLKVHGNLYIDAHGHKVVTLENMEVC